MYKKPIIILLLLLSEPLCAQHYIGDSIVAMVCDSINVYRKSLGLKPVAIEPKYKKFADIQSYNQSRYGFTTHGIGNNTIENRIKRDPYMLMRAFQENCTRVFYSDSDGLTYLASQIMLGLKSSKPHNASLINPDYEKMYVSCCKSGEYVYITLRVRE